MPHDRATRRSRPALTALARRRTAGPAHAAPFTSVLESQVHDVLFVLLIVVVFAILALIAKGAEKL